MSALPTAQPRSLWRYFPHFLIGGLAFVMVVNFGMVWTSLRTFPGVAALDVFDHSNAYDQVLAQAAREAALGWTVQTTAEAQRPVLTLTGADGQPISAASVIGEARRPLGPDMATQLVLREEGVGRYVADQPLPAVGQWELRLIVTQGAQTLHATRRIVAK